MATQAITANGTVIKIGAATIPEVTNITGVGGAFAVVDVSAHDGGLWSSKIPTLLDGGTIKVTMNFVPGNAQHIALRTALLARASTAFSMLYPPAGSPTWTFNAFVTSYKVPNFPVAGALMLEVDLTVDGPITMN